MKTYINEQKKECVVTLTDLKVVDEWTKVVDLKPLKKVLEALEILVFRAPIGRRFEPVMEHQPPTIKTLEALKFQGSCHFTIWSLMFRKIPNRSHFNTGINTKSVKDVLIHLSTLGAMIGFSRIISCIRSPVEFKPRL